MQRVFVDANVLYSKTLMDWLFLLKLHNPGMFQVHTTEDVCAEVLANMRSRHPQAPGHYTAHLAVGGVCDDPGEDLGEQPGGVPNPLDECFVVEPRSRPLSDRLV